MWYEVDAHLFFILKKVALHDYIRSNPNAVLTTTLMKSPFACILYVLCRIISRMSLFINIINMVVTKTEYWHCGNLTDNNIKLLFVCVHLQSIIPLSYFIY